MAGCLRDPPTAGGKRCQPDSGECGNGFACVTRAIDGSPLDLTDAGVCETDANDCPFATLTCPQNASLYVCAPRLDGDAGCFEGGSERLAGSVCMEGKGQCRTYGVYQWNDVDGGSCLMEASALRPTPHSECVDAGGPDPLCLCDGVDQNCNGVSDDFVGGFSSPYLSARVDPGDAGCTRPATTYQLLLGTPPAAEQVIDGQTVGRCAEITLAHSFSLDAITLAIGNASGDGACGVTGGGMPPTLALFQELRDGGYLGFAVDGGGSLAVPDGGASLPSILKIPMNGNARSFLLCLPKGAAAPLALTQLSVHRDLSAGRCDLP